MNYCIKIVRTHQPCSNFYILACAHDASVLYIHMYIVLHFFSYFPLTESSVWQTKAEGGGEGGSAAYSPEPAGNRAWTEARYNKLFGHK